MAGLELVNEARTSIVNGHLAYSTIYFDYDGHGSVRALTDTTGAVTDTYDYDAFGNLIHSTGSTPNVYLYSGEQFDPDLNLYYNRGRYLNVSSGRFWTMDAFEGDPEVPASLHKYLYVGDNAPNQIDPSGHFGLADYMAAAAVVLVLAAITYNHFFPTAEHFGLIWSSGIDWSAPLHSPNNTPTGSFTSGEIQTIKDQALQSLKLAFAPFLVTVEEGRQGAHTVVVDNTRTIIRAVEADCHTDAEGLSRVSFCHYPSISDNAQEVVGNSDLLGLALATGRGIGNAAAHEIGHQFALYKMHDASDGFYEHDGATPAFFLQDKLQWTAVSQGQLKSKLGANQ
jgi:RHS repeat-associated protein